MADLEQTATAARYIPGGATALPPLFDGGGGCPNCSALFRGGAMDRDDTITFELEIENATIGEEYEACVIGRTGQVTVTLDGSMPIGRHTARIIARATGSDGTSSRPVVVVTWSMNVQPVGIFGLSVNGRAQQQRLREYVADSIIGEQVDVGDTLAFPGFDLTSTRLAGLFDNFTRDGDGPVITLTVHSDYAAGEPELGQRAGVSLGDDLFVISTSGKMLLKASNPGRHRIELRAASGGTSPIVVLGWHMHIRSGPNGRRCDPDHGVVTDSPTDALNHTYTCTCTDHYNGTHCNIAPPVNVAAASSSDDNEATSLLVGGPLGAVVFLMVVAIMASRAQVYRLKHRPLDMGGMQDDVLDGLGIRLPKDIGAHEFGVSFTFDADLDPSSMAEPGLAELCTAMTSVLAKQLPRLKEELKYARALVSEASPNQLLLVIPRPRGYGELSDVAERSAVTLSKLATKRRLVIGPNTVSSATLALPRRIPRELDRAQLTRIAVLGEGAFGQVSLYQVVDPKRGVPPYKAAVKTVKPGVVALGNDELLREAALMAVLEHRYVLGLVGVVTAPRDLPAMIVLPYCEGGQLLDNIAQAGPDGLTATRRLTYAAQIALGMQYISARNIVHRDVAARNVLLDAMGDCKVADFGMSTSLVQTGRTYAAKYVRIHEEIALRWAAPEALQHERFSTASDVWAYGVTVWEIFACGLSEPYGDLGLGEVGPHVKGGGRLGVPPSDECPAQVYEELMLPCWAADPNDRLTFGELYDICVLHGAVEDQVTLDERAAKGTVSAAPMGDSRYLAPSVHC